MDFGTLAQKHNNDRAQLLENTPILAIDPGHTTGWAVFVGTDLAASGEAETSDIAGVQANITPLFEEFDPQYIVMEDYRIYRWRAKQHAGSTVPTIQVIGAIELITYQFHIANEVVKQPAHVAKQFCTDSKLKEWGFYITGQRHARDAIRHGCYFILFGKLGATT